MIKGTVQRIVLLSIFCGGVGMISFHSLSREPFHPVTTAAVQVAPDRVEIVRDAFGVPHIYAATDEEALYGFGYAQAEDHLLDMLENYLTAEGRKAEFFGPSYLESDVQARAVLNYGDDELLAIIDPETLQLVGAFVRGINRYIREHRAGLPEWARGFEVTVTQVLRFAHYTMISRSLSAAAKEFRQHSAFMAASQPLGVSVEASNQWVVGSSRTARGAPILLMDPHLPWSGMNRWYEAHLVGETLNVYGATFYGSPLIVMGHNGKIAWSMTRNAPDLADVFVEELHPDDPRRYRTESGWERMMVREESFKVRGSAPVVRKLSYTRNGWVVHSEPEHHRALVVALEGSDCFNTLAQFLAMARAQDIEQFKRAMAMHQLLLWNVMAADAQGNLYYVYNARLHERSEAWTRAEWRPGWDPNARWSSKILPFDGLPRVENPESDWMQNNNVMPWFVTSGLEMDPERFPSYLIVPAASLNDRGRRASDVLWQAHDWTMTDALKLATDTLVMAAEETLPEIFAAYESASPERRRSLAPAITLFRNWNRRGDIDQSGMTLFYFWWHHVKRQRAQDPLGGLEAAVSEMESLYGSIDVPWGQIHRIRRGTFDLPIAGEQQPPTLWMASGSLDERGRIYADHGSSFTMVVALGPRVEAYSLLPYGISENPDAPHYADQVPLKSRGELKRAWFYRDEILAHAERIDVLEKSTAQGERGEISRQTRGVPHNSESGGGGGLLRDSVTSSSEVIITVDATRPGPLIEGRLWGSNLTSLAPAARTVERANFVDATRQIGVRVIRWPGGNNASAYDWKRNEMIKPGRRVPRPDGVDIARILQFVRDTGAELSITVNFGTMTAQDAADLVEFLNGPIDSPWGARRAALGFPEPINVRYFEIGNEENQPHMWYYSWTAENPEKYFFGGEEERRGFYDNTSSQAYDPVGAKGDVFKAKGGPHQTYTLRFPPVRDVRVFWAATRQQVENRIYQEWHQVEDLSTQPSDARVFALDAEAGVLRFGDGVHGAMPPAGSFFLVEYTTYGHDGFLDFARAMRAAPSSVPIHIGAAVLPFRDGAPIADPDRMREIFQQMDFYVRHQYGISIPIRAYGSYAARRQIALERADHLAGVYGKIDQYLESLAVSERPSIAVTEWNIFLNEDYWHINRTLEGAVIAAEWFIRLLNASQHTPVAYAEQFALSGGNLALIRSQTNYSIAPMGYVFQGFSTWPGSRVLPVAVDSPSAMAYDREVPYVVAAAALSPDGGILRLAMINNAEQRPLTATLHINGFTPASARLWRLWAEDPAADNDRYPTNVVLSEEPLREPPTHLALPPHSVTFLELQAPSEKACRRDANGTGALHDVTRLAAIERLRIDPLRRSLRRSLSDGISVSADVLIRDGDLPLMMRSRSALLMSMSSLMPMTVLN